MKIEIILLHYRNFADTLCCLKSIGQLKRNHFFWRVILVNNDSELSASQVELCRNSVFSRLKLIQNPKNFGFAKGINIGLREAFKEKTADYFLILNNDTLLPNNFFSRLIQKEADILSPVIKFRWQGKWVYDYGGKVNWWIGRTKHFESLKRGFFQKWREKEIDYVSGCCMLVRREVLEKIGLFDERYFFYFEDVDFCLRAKKAGFKVEVNPKVVVYHKLSGSLGFFSGKAIFYHLWGNFIFISKNLGWRRPFGYFYLSALAGKIIFDRIFGR